MGAVESARGHLLVATPQLMDPNFARSVVLVLEHSEDGALGVVLNRPSSESVNGVLPDWAPVIAPPRVVFAGGPVETGAVLGVATAAEGDGFEVVDLTEPPDALRPGSLRLFAGYAGWGPGQLDAELAEGSWFVLDAELGDLVDDDPDDLWARVLRRQGGLVSLLATYPPAPWLN